MSEWNTAVTVLDRLNFYDRVKCASDQMSLDEQSARPQKHAGVNAGESPTRGVCGLPVVLFFF